MSLRGSSLLPKQSPTCEYNYRSEIASLRSQRQRPAVVSYFLFYWLLKYWYYLPLVVLVVLVVFIVLSTTFLF